MSYRSGLLTSIAERISSYRNDEIPQPTVEHVERWVEQFDPEVQLPILSEMDFVFKKTYYSKQMVQEHLCGLIDLDFISSTEKTSPTEYWRKAHVLDIQQRGSSQTDIKALFGDLLKKKLNLNVEECGLPGGDYIYLDDFLFSGHRIKEDILDWIEKEDRDGATVRIIVMASHSAGELYCDKGLNNMVEKNITIKLWRRVCFENTTKHLDNSEVLWPTSLPEIPEFQDYISGDVEFKKRKRGGYLEHATFSSGAMRRILEDEMLFWGWHIYNNWQQRTDQFMRPLGRHMSRHVGFGSMLATYRNCPNTVPLAIWWGNPEKCKWYPLLPRKPNKQDFDAY